MNGPSLSQPYLARMPKHIFQKGFAFRNEAKRFWRGMEETLRYAMLPFESSPGTPDDPPAPDTLDDATIERCEKLLDGVEETRDQLEQKARGTFAMIAFLAPLLAALFVYVLKQPGQSVGARGYFYVLAGISAFAIVVGFISIVRAVSVRRREQLFLDMFLDSEKKAFRPKDDARYVQGLLYCASMNAAHNSHIAQLVKSGHVLTAFAIILAMISALPAATLMSSGVSPVRSEIVAPVQIYSSKLADIADEIRDLTKTLNAFRSEISSDRNQEIARRVAELEAKIKKYEASPPKKKNAK